VLATGCPPATSFAGSLKPHKSGQCSPRGKGVPERRHIYAAAYLVSQRRDEMASTFDKVRDDLIGEMLSGYGMLPRWPVKQPCVGRPRIQNNAMRSGACIGRFNWLPAFALALALTAVRAEDLRFELVTLDNSYIAYERDVGDIDGDGDSDLAAIQEGETRLVVFRAPGWNRSTLFTFTGNFRYPRADDFKMADIDGDGDLDVVTRLGDGPSSDGAGLAVWCENLGGGSNFTQRLIGKSLEYVKDIVVADFDRDTRLDVGMRMDNQTQLWLQNADLSFSEILLAHPAHEGMEAGDLDGDGDPDLILNGFWFTTPNTPAAARVATNYSRRVIDSAWFNQGGDWTADSCKVVVGDFDQDGTNDVAFSHSERAGFSVAWYRSSRPNGAGPWIKNPVTAVDYCHNLQAADWDLDGDVDLLVGGMIQSKHSGLKLMLNNGKATKWSEFTIQSQGSYSAETGDIDNDGDPDIVGIRNWNSAPTYIYRNNSARDKRRQELVR
jgi:hypothetical protein